MVKASDRLSFIYACNAQLIFGILFAGVKFLKEAEAQTYDVIIVDSSDPIGKLVLTILSVPWL